MDRLETGFAAVRFTLMPVAALAGGGLFEQGEIQHWKETKQNPVEPEPGFQFPAIRRMLLHQLTLEGAEA